MTLDAIAPPLDLAALVYFGLAIFIYRIFAARRAESGGGLMGAIQHHRLNWMLNMAKREQRMLDAILLGSLSQGNPPPAPSRSVVSRQPWGRARSCRRCLRTCPTPVRPRP
jgi:uncharacterized membrane protein